jgi:hypothetical protein
LLVEFTALYVSASAWELRNIEELEGRLGEEYV